MSRRACWVASSARSDHPTRRGRLGTAGDSQRWPTSRRHAGRPVEPEPRVLGPCHRISWLAVNPTAGPPGSCSDPRRVRGPMTGGIMRFRRPWPRRPRQLSHRREHADGGGVLRWPDAELVAGTITINGSLRAMPRHTRPDVPKGMHTGLRPQLMDVSTCIPKCGFGNEIDANTPAPSRVRPDLSVKAGPLLTLVVPRVTGSSPVSHPPPLRRLMPFRLTGGHQSRERPMGLMS